LEFFFLGGIVVLPGWHHIVAASTGCPLATPLRADDVSVKTAGWLVDFDPTQPGRANLSPGLRRPDEGGNHDPFGKGLRYR